MYMRGRRVVSSSPEALCSGRPPIFALRIITYIYMRYLNVVQLFCCVEVNKTCSSYFCYLVLACIYACSSSSLCCSSRFAELLQMKNSFLMLCYQGLVPNSRMLLLKLHYRKIKILWTKAIQEATRQEHHGCSIGFLLLMAFRLNESHLCSTVGACSPNPFGASSEVRGGVNFQYSDIREK